MPKASVQQFSTTAASNTDIAGVSVATGWPPANVGPAFREFMALVASSLVPLALDVTGLASLTPTAAQASAQVIQFVGTPSGDCTIALPNALFFGYAQNSTSGGHNVILTAGGGTALTLPPGGSILLYQCDGAGNVAAPQFPQSVLFGAFHNLTSGRALGTTYTNATGRPMFLGVSTTGSGTPFAISLTVNGEQVQAPGGSGSGILSVSFVLSPLATYNVSSVVGSNAIAAWTETY